MILTVLIKDLTTTFTCGVRQQNVNVQLCNGDEDSLAAAMWWKIKLKYRGFLKTTKIIQILI